MPGVSNMRDRHITARITAESEQAIEQQLAQGVFASRSEAISALIEKALQIEESGSAGGKQVETVIEEKIIEKIVEKEKTVYIDVEPTFTDDMISSIPGVVFGLAMVGSKHFISDSIMQILVVSVSVIASFFVVKYLRQ